MANRHKKKCSTSFEAERNANQNYNVVSPHTSQNGHHQKKSTNNKFWRECGEKGTLLHCWWECKLIQPLWRTVCRFLKKLKIGLPYDPAIPILGIQPEKSIIPKDTHSTVFIAVLFTIARTWKQPKCPSVGEWIKKIWCIYTMQYYSAIKRNEIGSFLVIWMDLESVIQSEVRKKEKNKYLIASLGAQMVKNMSSMLETWIRSLGWEDPLEKEMATHSSILAWRIPWTEEPGGLQSMGLQELDMT